jgi:hypothetical protein
LAKNNLMYTTLLHTHSGLRWLVLLLAIYAIFKAFRGKKENAPFAGSFKSSATLFVASLHVQFLVGLVLYLQSPWFRLLQEDAGAVMKNSASRFFAIEHVAMMFIAVILATVGNAVAKRAAVPASGYQKRIVWFTITLLIILIAVPWPFRFGNSGWF